MFQLAIDGLQADFAPLKTLGAASSLPLATTPLVGRDGELAELAGSAEFGGSATAHLAPVLAQGFHSWPSTSSSPSADCASA